MKQASPGRPGKIKGARKDSIRWVCNSTSDDTLKTLETEDKEERRKARIAGEQDTYSMP